MTSSLDYLKTLPAFYINVDGHRDREAAFIQRNNPLFKELIRVPAIPLGNVLEEANDFSARVRWSRENADHLGHFAKFQSIYTIQEFKSETKRAREYAATRSLAFSTLKAIMTAREMGYERFMLMDDDAAPRLQVLENVKSAPQDADIRVWGGAYSSGGLRRDNERFLAGEKERWINVNKSTRTRFFSHAYEMNVAGAEAMEYALRNHFNAVDLCWWYAFARCEAYTLQPGGFTQVGESIRTVKHNPRTREGDTVR